MNSAMQTATGAIGPKTSVCASSTVGKAQLQAISRFVEVQSDGLVRLSSHIVAFVLGALGLMISVTIGGA